MAGAVKHMERSHRNNGSNLSAFQGFKKFDKKDFKKSKKDVVLFKFIKRIINFKKRQARTQSK